MAEEEIILEPDANQDSHKVEIPKPDQDLLNFYETNKAPLIAFLTGAIERVPEDKKPRYRAMLELVNNANVDLSKFVQAYHDQKALYDAVQQEVEQLKKDNSGLEKRVKSLESKPKKTVPDPDLAKAVEERASAYTERDKARIDRDEYKEKADKLAAKLSDVEIILQNKGEIEEQLQTALKQLTYQQRAKTSLSSKLTQSEKQADKLSGKISSLQNLIRSLRKTSVQNTEELRSFLINTFGYKSKDFKNIEEDCLQYHFITRLELEIYNLLGKTNSIFDDESYLLLSTKKPQSTLDSAKKSDKTPAKKKSQSSKKSAKK